MAEDLQRLLFLDLSVLPATIDLHLLRRAVTAGSMLVLLYGLLWDSEKRHDDRRVLAGIRRDGFAGRGHVLSPFLDAHPRFSVHGLLHRVFIPGSHERGLMPFKAIPDTESVHGFNLGQLCTYLLILAAILRKNRRAR